MEFSCQEAHLYDHKTSIEFSSKAASLVLSRKRERDTDEIFDSKLKRQKIEYEDQLLSCECYEHSTDSENEEELLRCDNCHPKEIMRLEEVELQKMLKCDFCDPDTDGYCEKCKLETLDLSECQIKDLLECDCWNSLPAITDDDVDNLLECNCWNSLPTLTDKEIDDLLNDSDESAECP